MREIKFRVWDDGEMHYVTQLSIYGEEYEVDLCDADGNQEYFGLIVKGKELMQYTGFKDENGKEIYEGDIVKCTDGEGGVSELNSDTGIGRVEWLEKFGFWNISNIENGLGDIIFNGFVEIIGNIYESPELLHGNKTVHEQYKEWKNEI